MLIMKKEGFRTLTGLKLAQSTNVESGVWVFLLLYLIIKCGEIYLTSLDILGIFFL